MSVDFSSYLNLNNLFKEQQTDNELQLLISNPADESKFVLRKIQVSFSDISIWCDTSSYRPRPYVPLSLRKALIDTLHSISHPELLLQKN